MLGALFEAADFKKGAVIQHESEAKVMNFSYGRRSNSNWSRYAKSLTDKEVKITQEIVHIYNSMEGSNTSKSSS